MPERAIVSKALADFLGVLSHPKRVRLIEELRDGERDVNSLQAVLGISHSGVSQHLSLLRASRVVTERREGRHVYYQLRHPGLARWLADGTTFLEVPESVADQVRTAVRNVRAEWLDGSG